MKVISKKTFEVTVVAPDSPEEDQEMKKIIKEVKEEKFDKGDWKVINNLKNDDKIILYIAAGEEV